MMSVCPICNKSNGAKDNGTKCWFYTNEAIPKALRTHALFEN